MITAYKITVKGHVSPRQGYDGFWRGKSFWPNGSSQHEFTVVRAELLADPLTKAEAEQAIADGAIDSKSFAVLMADPMVGAVVVSSRKVEIRPQVEKPKPPVVTLLDELDQEEATRPSKAR